MLYLSALLATTMLAAPQEKVKYTITAVDADKQFFTRRLESTGKEDGFKLEHNTHKYSITIQPVFQGLKVVHRLVVNKQATADFTNNQDLTGKYFVLIHESASSTEPLTITSSLRPSSFEDQQAIQIEIDSQIEGGDPAPRQVGYKLNLISREPDKTLLEGSTANGNTLKVNVPNGPSFDLTLTGQQFGYIDTVVKASDLTLQRSAPFDYGVFLILDVKDGKIVGADMRDGRTVPEARNLVRPDRVVVQLIETLPAKA